MATLDTTPPAAAEPTPVVAQVAPARKVPSWLTPVLAIVAALVIGLFGGILIGKGTAPSTQRAGFSQGAGAGQGFGQGGGGTGGFRPNGGQAGGQTGTQGGSGTQGGAGGTGGVAGGFGNFTAGTIQSMDGSTITIKEQDGTVVKVTTSGTTTVTTTTKSSVSKLKSGQTVVVRGAKDSSGSVAATSISEGAAGGRLQR
jgi:hypothetical protein